MKGRLTVRHLGQSTLAGLEHDYSGPEVRIGTGPSCHVVFDSEYDAGVAEVHALLRLDAQGASALPVSEDAAVVINGERIHASRRICPDDVISLGEGGPSFGVTVRELAVSGPTADAMVGRAAAAPSLRNPFTPPAFGGGASGEVPAVRDTSDRAPTPTPTREDHSAPTIMPTLQGQRRRQPAAEVPAAIPPVRIGRGGGAPASQGASPSQPPRFGSPFQDSPPQPPKRSKPQAFNTIFSSIRSRGERSIGVNTLMGVIEAVTLRERKRSTRLIVLGIVAALVMGSAALWTLMPTVEAQTPRGFVEVFARIQDSVCLVLERPENAFGTAWSLKEGVFATNAHVAEAFLEDENGKRPEIFIRTPGENPRDMRVIDVVLHPGYEEFDRLTQRYLPFDPHTGRPIRPFRACDVALLKIDPRDVDKQPPPIPLADVSESLRPGTNIASVGYPMEGVRHNPRRPAPETRVGTLVKYTDAFDGSVPFDGAELLTFQWTSAGGASGSPIVNEAGEVIGLLSAGNVAGRIEGVRVSVGGTSVGPVVRMLRELLDSTATDAQVSRGRAWTETFRDYFEAGTADPVRFALSLLILLGNIDPQQQLLQLISNQTATMNVGGGSGRLQTTIAFPRAGDYHIVVLSVNRPTAIRIVGDASAQEEPKYYFDVFGGSTRGALNHSLDIEAARGEEDGRTEIAVVVFRVESQTN